MADSFLVLVPHKTLHGTISILIQRPKLATNVGKTGAVKNKMPFIPQCPGPAQSAAAEMPGDGRFSKPTLFHRQGMRPHAELHQQPYPGNGHWKLKVRHSFQLTGTQKPCKICAEFCPFGAVLGDTCRPSQTLQSRPFMCSDERLIFWPEPHLS